VKRNLGRLIDAGQLRPAMQLALGLMTQGSYQVEMSDSRSTLTRSPETAKPEQIRFRARPSRFINLA
jgi:hypothetical protein